ncbi:MAG: Gfo/Idh/MocA family oxidoreductase [Christensenellaceae bacterium]
MQKHEKLKSVIIGCGNIFLMHAAPICTSDYAYLCAVCDIKQERAQTAAKKFNCKAYTDYQTMLDVEQPDVVHVCTPHYLHAPIAIAALAHGCHVLCEKPMAISLEDADKMLNAAQNAQKTLAIIFQNRYNPGSQLIKDFLTNGRLGDILAGRMLLTWNRSMEYYAKSDWKGTLDKEGGGVLIDQAIHTLDLMRWFMDRPVIGVSASVANRAHPSIAVEDTAEGCIEFDKGIYGAFYVMNYFSTDAPVRLELECTNGKAIMEGPRGTVNLNNGFTASADNDPLNMFEYGDVKSYWGTSHIKQINNFYKSILGEERLYITAEDAYKTQKLLCEIYDVSRNAHKTNT